MAGSTKVFRVGELTVNSFVSGTEKMSLCKSQAAEVAVFMMLYQPHEQRSGRDREGEKRHGWSGGGQTKNEYKEQLMR